MPETQIPIPSYEEMIKAGMHFGRKKTIFNPKMEPYVYTVKESIYIIDLIKTTDAIIKVVNFLKKAIGEGKMVLFIGITKQSADLIKSLADDLNMPYAINRWLGGTLTNFKTINARVKYLEELEADHKSGKFEKYTKKERLEKEREIKNLKEKFEGLKKLTRLPDIIFVSSVSESSLPLREAKRTGVKIIGIINTDSDPTQIDYPIPANDNARKSVELILETIRKALKP